MLECPISMVKYSVSKFPVGAEADSAGATSAVSVIELMAAIAMKTMKMPPNYW